MDVNYRSLKFWRIQEEFTVFEAICLWLDYVPRTKMENQKYPGKWETAHHFIVQLIKDKKLDAWASKPKDVPEALKDFPFDKPVNYDDYVVDKTSQKKEIIPSLQSWVNNLRLGGKGNVGLNEYPIHVTFLKKEDLKRIADQIGSRPLFIYPEGRKKLRDMWPEKSALTPPGKKVEPVSIAPMVKAKTIKQEAKQKKTVKQNPNTKEPKRAVLNPESGKWKINILHDEIKVITRRLLKEKPSITTPGIANSNDVKVARDKHNKGKVYVTDKTIENWIRDVRRKESGPLRAGRPLKKKPSRQFLPKTRP